MANYLGYTALACGGGAAYMGYQKVRSMISHVNPALNIPLEELTRKRDNIGSNFPDHEIISVPTDEGFNLDGVWLGESNKEKVIVFSLGIGGTYEEAGDSNSIGYLHMKALQDAMPDHAIVIVNGRELGRSGGTLTSIDDYKSDTKSVVAYLQGHGIQAENLIVYGHSLGCVGAIGSHNRLILDRTFDHISELVCDKAGVKNSALRSAVSGILFGLKWNTNNSEAVKSLDGAKVVVMNHFDDPTISRVRSLFEHVEANDNVARITLMDTSDQEHNVAVTAHTRPLSVVELIDAFRRV